MITMTDAAGALERLCDEMENISDITEQVQALFAEKSLKLSEAVDRRIRYIEYLKSQIAHADMVAMNWDIRKKKMELVLDKLKEDTIQVVKSSTVPMIGEIGRLKVVKNSVPTVVVDENDEDLKLFYTREKLTRILDKTAIRQDLLSGIQIRGAKLEYGEHLRWS